MTDEDDDVDVLSEWLKYLCRYLDGSYTIRKFDCFSDGKLVVWLYARVIKIDIHKKNQTSEFLNM